MIFNILKANLLCWFRILFHSWSQYPHLLNEISQNWPQISTKEPWRDGETPDRRSGDKTHQEITAKSCYAFVFFFLLSPTPFSVTFISQGRFLIKLLCLFNNTLHFALLRMEWVIQHWPHQRTASFIFDNKKNIFHHNELNRKTRVTASSVGGSWNGRNYHVSRVRFNTVFHFALLLKITV